MSESFATLGQFLTEDQWHPAQLEGKSIYRIGFSGTNGKTACYAQIREDLSQLLIYVMAPIKVPAELRADMAEFITRANYGLRIGNFEMDFSDGEVRYKSSVDFEGIVLNNALIKNTIYPAVQTMDKYLPGIMKLIYGEGMKSPAELIAAIEEK